MGTRNDSDLDYWHTDNIVCPHCGHEHEDCGEIFDRHDTTRMNCEECDLEFEVSRDFSVHYSSSKIDHEAEARKAAEDKQRRAVRIEKCRRFPPGTPVRVTAGSRAGQHGVVENREVSTYVSIVNAAGRHISADPEDVEVIK